MAKPVSEPSELDAFYRRVEARANELSRRHAERLHCRPGCSGCCSDGLSVWRVEAARIRRRHAALLRETAPHPEGACAFLDDEGACRIYADRPYVCRTQGLPLRWFESAPRNDPPVVERRDICPLNLDGPALESLPDEECWLLGPAEEELARLEGETSDARERVALRSLFEPGT